MHSGISERLPNFTKENLGIIEFLYGNIWNGFLNIHLKGNYYINIVKIVWLILIVFHISERYLRNYIKIINF